jgi:hypothetical protein
MGYGRFKQKNLSPSQALRRHVRKAIPSPSVAACIGDHPFDLRCLFNDIAWTSAFLKQLLYGFFLGAAMPRVLKGSTAIGRRVAPSSAATSGLAPRYGERRAALAAPFPLRWAAVTGRQKILDTKRILLSSPLSTKCALTARKNANSSSRRTDSETNGPGDVDCDETAELAEN